MAFVSVSEAAILVGKSNPTIYRHIKAGKLSRNSEGTIDTTELLRVYGNFVTNKNQNETSITPTDTESDNQKWLKSQIEKLQNDLKELKAESLARESRLMTLLENKSEKDTTPIPKSFLGKLFN